MCVLSCFSWDQLFVMLWTVVHQAPLWNSQGKNTGASSLPFSPPGDLPNPEIEPVSFGLLHCRQILYHWAIREAQEYWSE